MNISCQFSNGRLSGELTNGVLIIDGGYLTVEGNIFTRQNAQFILRNNGSLKIKLAYQGQYMFYMSDSSAVVSDNSTMNWNGTIYTFNLYDKSRFIANHTQFADWIFHRMTGKSKMDLTYINKVGDFTLDDSSDVKISHSDIVMPWLSFYNGASASFDLPSPNFVNHFVFPAVTDTVTGVHSKLTLDSCSTVMWSMINWTGSNVHVKNSWLYSIYVRFNPNLTNVETITNLHDSTSYNNITMPFTDKNLQLENTTVVKWGLTSMNQVSLIGDSLDLFESFSYDSSSIEFNHAHFNGTHCGSLGRSKFTLRNSLVEVPIIVNDSSTFIIENSDVIPTGQYLSVSVVRDKAHFLCSNTTFAYEPNAEKKGVIVYAFLDSIHATTMQTNINLNGSAWTKQGPNSTVVYGGYSIDWKYQDSTNWNNYYISSNTVQSGLFTTFNLPSLNNNFYIRLKVWKTAGDTAIAIRSLINTTTGLNHFEKQIEPNIYPNPSNTLININCKNGFQIYNSTGQLVKHNSQATTQINISDLPKGLYIIKADNRIGRFIKSN